MHARDAVAIATAVRERRLSAVESCTAALELAAADELGAVWELAAEPALAEAAALDRRLDRGEDAGLLAGVPVGVKDCFDVAGLPTTNGIASVPRPAPAAHDADAVARLRQAGAIVIAKTAMHQLAWGMSGQAPGFPPCRNPVDRKRQPGGSSSGSAVAAGAGIVPLALGTDTGGSIRQPAGWCGVVGFKPTRQLVSLAGCAPLAPSLDTCGVIARSVDDCELGLTVLTGRPWGRERLEGLRVGVLAGLLASSDGEVATVVEDALRAWSADGATLVELELPAPRRALGPIYAAEFAASWGSLVDANPDAFGQDVRAGIAAGRQVAAVEYLAAAETVARLRADAAQRLADLDVVACPTTPVTAPLLDAPDDVALAGRHTRIFNGLGWPSISIPCGSAAGLPVGLMLAGLSGGDDLLLTAAASAAAALR